MTDKELRDAAVAELKGTVAGYKLRPHSPRWNRAMALLAQIGQAEPSPISPLYRVTMPQASSFNSYFMVHDSDTSQIVGDGVSGDKHRVIRWGPGGLYEGRQTWASCRFRLIKGNPGRTFDWHTQPNDVGGWTPSCSGGVAPIAVDYFDTRGLEVVVEPENAGCSGGSGNYHFPILSQGEIEALRGKPIELLMQIAWGRRDELPVGAVRVWMNGEAAPRVNATGINTHWKGEQQVTFWEGAYWNKGNPTDVEFELAATRFGTTREECLADAPRFYSAGGTGVSNGRHEVIA